FANLEADRRVRRRTLALAMLIFSTLVLAITAGLVALLYHQRRQQAAAQVEPAPRSHREPTAQAVRQTHVQPTLRLPPVVQPVRRQALSQRTTGLMQRPIPPPHRPRGQRPRWGPTLR